MSWLMAGVVLAYGFGATVTSMWYGGASTKSRRHGGAVGTTSLVRISAQVFLIWWYLAPAAYLSRLLYRRRVTREAL